MNSSQLEFGKRKENKSSYQPMKNNSNRWVILVHWIGGCTPKHFERERVRENLVTRNNRALIFLGILGFLYF